MKLTRRKLAITLAPSLARLSRVGLVAARSAAAQTPAASQPAASPQPSPGSIEAARARMRQTSELLAQQTVPMDAEPAFQFKA